MCKDSSTLNKILNINTIFFTKNVVNQLVSQVSLSWKRSFKYLFVFYLPTNRFVKLIVELAIGFWIFSRSLHFTLQLSFIKQPKLHPNQLCPSCLITCFTSPQLYTVYLWISNQFNPVHSIDQKSLCIIKKADVNTLLAIHKSFVKHPLR